MHKSLTIIFTLCLTSLVLAGCTNFMKKTSSQDDSAMQGGYEENINMLNDSELLAFRQELGSRPILDPVTASAGHTGTQNPALIMYIFPQQPGDESETVDEFATTINMYDRIE